MLLISAWILFGLGVGHTVVGLYFFKRQFALAYADGWFGKFQVKGQDRRRLAFWFTVFGPLLMMGGQVALHAVQLGDFVLLRMIGCYLVVIGLAGVSALPKSPFWGAVLIAPVFILAG